MQNEDWPLVSEIYAQGIATGYATFETEIPGYGAWDKAHLQNCRFVAEHEGDIAGWAALSPVSGRCVYGGVAEVSVYVAKARQGLGIGRKLMSHLIPESEKEGIWTLQSGIFPENTASIKLHEKSGFRKIGYRERVGKLHGQCSDRYILSRLSDSNISAIAYA